MIKDEGELIMNIMKRYVREFANDVMKGCCDSDKQEIERVIKHAERGLISSVEAVDAILRIYMAERKD
jgi:hypothetical protein